MANDSSEVASIVCDLPPPEDDIEVLLTPKLDKRNNLAGWATPSGRYSVNTLETMGTKVANDLSGFSQSDDNSQKTWGRRFVETILMKIPWYYPNKGIHDRPKLEDGWAFYEHVTLARHFRRENKSDPLERAEPGERRETDLYQVFRGGGAEMNDFGIGVALYFNTMLVMGVALLVGGLMHLPNILYYLSAEYDGRDQTISIDLKASSKFLTIPASAVCNNFVWAQCESKEFCNLKKLKDMGVDYLYNSVDDITLVKKNNCNEFTFQQGMVNFVAVMTALLIIVLFNIYQSKKEIIYDEDKVTASDYSVVVKNPPKDAFDPDEWEEFFSKYDIKGIAVVTVLLNNGPLLRQIMTRRTLRKDLMIWFPSTDIDNEQLLQNKLASQQWEPSGCVERFIQFAIRPLVKPFGMLLHAPEIVKRLQDVDKRIIDLQTVEYEVTDVIVTFETEDGQRLALETLKCGQMDIRSQRIGSRKEEELFRGKHILDCEQPDEPSAIRYLDIDTNPMKSALQQTLTFVITIGLVALGGVMVDRTRKSSGPFWAGVLVTSMNILIPNIAKILVIFEQHASEDYRQKSMYFKIAVFRWINTAMIAKVTTPFTSQLGSENFDVIPAMNGIFISEMFLPPVLNILDIMGNISKHYFAPRARTVQQMLLCFKGTPYNLAEKYTDVSKIVFVAYFYAAINPPLLFFGSAALFIRYFSDKFCIMRIWSSAPYIGPKLSNFSRKYFLTLAIVIGALVSAYDWAQFPYDRICKGSTESSGTFANESFLYSNGTQYNDGSDISVQNKTVRVCNEKKCCQEIGFDFPPVPEVFQSKDFEYMSNDQEDVSRIYGWTSVGLITAFGVIAFGGAIVKFIISLFKGVYRPVGQDQKIDFSSIKDIDGYIPQVRIGSYSYPLIACNIDDVNLTLIGWNDPGTSYDEYNVIFDINHKSVTRRTKIAGSTRKYGKLRNHKDFRDSTVSDENIKPIFSVVKQWDLSERRDGGLVL